MAQFRDTHVTDADRYVTRSTKVWAGMAVDEAQRRVNMADRRQDVRKEGANARQVAGTHYKASAIEHWDWAASTGQDYFQGQITKYVDRWKRKNGIEDLKKAQHFLEKYIELVEAGVVKKDETERDRAVKIPFEHDSEALAILQMNFEWGKPEAGLIRRKKADHQPTPLEFAAIDYLCDEWDYAWKGVAQ